MSQAQLKICLNERQLHHWNQQKKRCTPMRLLENLEKRRIQYRYYKEAEFPNKMYQIPDPPFGIFYAGRLPLESERTVAMIGARKCSEYGSFMAKEFAEEFARQKISIISGMAMGIDGISQSAALGAGGCSYGILGSGVDVIYPPGNAPLYYELCDKGGILSESVPGTEAKPGLFPQRNRLISALADVVLVVEAREKSGTLITVDMALEQGKEIYAIPGRCSDRLSIGCNRLLRQGAAAAVTPQDIMEDMGWNTISVTGKETDSQEEGLSQAAMDIKKVMDVEPLGADEILRKLKMKNSQLTLPQIYQGILELELRGMTARSCGKYNLKITKK